MASAEVTKRKGRPRKNAAAAEVIAVVIDNAEQPPEPEPKAKRLRVTRKPATADGELENNQAKITKRRTEDKRGSTPSITPKATKTSKNRSNESGLTGSSKPVEAGSANPPSQIPFTEPVSSEILSQANAFKDTKQIAESAKVQEESVRESPASATSALPKEFKSAGTLPAFHFLAGTLKSSAGLPQATSTSKPSASASTPFKPPRSSFLVDFLTEPLLAEQPAWSRPKKAGKVGISGTEIEAAASSITTATVSDSKSKAEPAESESARPDTSALLSASPLPTIERILTQDTAENSLASVKPSLQNHRGEQELSLSKKSNASPSPAATVRFFDGQDTTSIQTSALLSPTSHATKATHFASMSASAPPTSDSTSNPTPKPVSSTRVPPIPSSSFPAKPPPPRPSTLSHDQLRQDPRFRALSRKYTRLMVAIPILLVTSVVLYGRVRGTAVRKQIGEETQLGGEKGANGGAEGGRLANGGV